MQTALLLIALGFGFKIFAEASANNKKSVKQLGRLIGIIIMVISLFGTICTVWCAAKCGLTGYGSYFCPLGGKGGKAGYRMAGKRMCPITGQPIDIGTSGK